MLLEVGDTLIIKTSLGYVYKHVITRVTKTLAKSKRESDGFEYTYKRLISSDMSHPAVSYNKNEYTVVRKQKTGDN